MAETRFDCSRRTFLGMTAALTGGITALPSRGAEPPELLYTKRPLPAKDGRKPLAVICTVYRPMSHAYHIAGRFILGYVVRGRMHVPKYYVKTMYVDQFPENDLSGQASRELGVRVTRSIADALTDGGGKLAVDGVLLIAEHGDYPKNDKGQILYPRYEWMEQIVDVFRKTGQVVPVFNDKHLSYSWKKAKQMYDWSRELKFPFMAGSSLPVTWRRPEMELPLETPVEDGLIAAYGPIEVYGIHALEALQTMMERRRGGETGLKAVTCLTGEEVWKAGDAGRWSWPLLDAALATSETVNPGDIRRNVGLQVGARLGFPPIAFLLEYRDGTRGTVLLLNGHIQDFCFATRIRGREKPAACLFYLPQPPGARFFDGQVLAIEKLLETGKPPYPVERTLLTSGILDAAMTSHQQKGRRVETPELALVYAAPAESGFMRGPLSAVATPP